MSGVEHLQLQSRLDRPLSPSRGLVLRRQVMWPERWQSPWEWRRNYGAEKDVEACLRHFMLTGGLSVTYDGWRDVVGASFLQILETAA